MSNLATLDALEESELRKAEQAIERNLRSFKETGEALMLIRDNRLYRADFKTFEEYCQKRWNFTHRHANRFIESAEVIRNLGPVGPKPSNERQARPLTKLPKDEQADAWEEAVKIAPEGKVAAKHVEEVVERRTRKIEHVEQPKIQGVGIIRANEAINCLIRDSKKRRIKEAWLPDRNGLDQAQSVR